MVEVLTGISAKANPKVSPSAHLWQITASDSPKTSPFY
jgi:hypothetical protein